MYKRQICNLAVEDEPVHAAYEKFFRTFNRMDTGDFMDDDSNYDDLRRAIMVSRYLDRIAAISIDAACRLTFLLTGQRMTCLLYTSTRRRRSTGSTPSA